MTNDGWSKEWPVQLSAKDEQSIKDFHTDVIKANTIENGVWPTVPNPITDPVAFVASLWPTVIGVDKGSDDQTTLVVGKVIDGILNVNEMLTGNEADVRLAMLTGTGIILTTIKEGVIVQKIVDPSEYNNKVPTHDPYTNPNAHIYHECACGAILDPGTKSFAALNNVASQVGWKIRWGHEGYVAYCVECGKGVE